MVLLVLVPLLFASHILAYIACLIVVHRYYHSRTHFGSSSKSYCRGCTHSLSFHFRSSTHYPTLANFLFIFFFLMFFLLHFFSFATSNAVLHVNNLCCPISLLLIHIFSEYSRLLSRSE